MLWFPLALATAIFNATEAALVKLWLSDLRPLELTALPFLYLAPIMGVVLLVIDIPALGPGFWPLFLILLPLNAVGVLLHFRAIWLSPMSLTMPFLAFTPAFVILTGFLFLGEQLHPLGILGIAAIVVGGYVLGRSGRDHSLLGPLKALARERGSLYMFGASLVYAFCSVMGKKLILLSSPLFMGGFFFLVFGTGLTLALLALGLVRPRVLVQRPLHCSAIGLILAGHVICHHLSISMVAAAYMMSIKRLNAVFSVLYGWLLFKEEDIRYRLTGAALMTVGAAVIVLWG